MRDEAFALQLLSMAERWAGACGATLRDRKDFTSTVFSVTRRPEERALLEELRQITLETITVDDFDSHELRAASYYDPPLPGKREAA